MTTKHAAASHSDDLKPLLGVLEPRISFFQTVRIFEGSNRIREVDAVLAMVVGGFAVVPFVLHERYYRIPVVGATNPSI